MEPNCVSINLNKRVDGNGNYKCELNNATHEGHEDELKKEENYFYHAAEVVATSFKNLPFHKSNCFTAKFSIIALLLDIILVILKIIIIVIIIIITIILIIIIIIITIFVTL